MFSTDDGGNWQRSKLNLPTVAVHDLVVKDDDLVVGTHGRSIWILDDLQPIREFDATIAVERRASASRLPTPCDGVGSGGYGHARRELLESAARRIDLLLPQGEAEGRAEDRDPRRRRTGSCERSSSVPRQPEDSSDDEDPEELKKQALRVEPGIQRAVWDLPGTVRGRSRTARSTPAIRSNGPRRCPGTYTVRLTVDGKTLTAPLGIVADPRGRACRQAELEAQLDVRARACATTSRS